MTLTREFITDILTQSVLDPRQRALYEMCFLHRNHFQDEVVADKLRLIARLFAEGGPVASAFSAEATAHGLGQSGIDRWFGALATAEQIDAALLLEVHKRVMDVFAAMPEAEARAMAARYLHFHFPELFYIHDSVLERAARSLTEGGACGYLALAQHDPAYGRFFACCRRLTERLVPLVGRRLSPRELDRVLRAWAEHEDVVAQGLSRAAALSTLHA
jgi:hypothetical protein